MKFINKIDLKKLEENIGKKRFIHSKNVMKEAINLGKIYDCDIGKCEVAGLLHDCGKLRPYQRQLDKLEEYNIELDSEILAASPIVHAYLGAYLAKFEYGIADEEILDAIRYHTIGRKNMTKLEKIVFIADFIEIGRDFPGVEKLRKLAYKDLDIAVYEGVKQNLLFIINSDYHIYEPAISIYNYMRSKRDESI